MKYLVRSLKYLIYFVILFFIIVIIISFLNHQDISDFQTLFVDGALAKISGLFIIIALAYPAFGFKKNYLRLEGDYDSYTDIIVETMGRLGYRLKEKDPVNMVFRADKASIRFSRMWEDAITFSITEDPNKITVDGPYKDTIRVIRAIDYYYRNSTNQNEDQTQSE